MGAPNEVQHPRDRSLAVPVHANLRGVTEPEQRRFGPTTPSVDVGSVQPSFGVYQFF